MKHTRQKAAPIAPTIAATRSVVNGSVAGRYVPQWGPQRPGQDDALSKPSRMGNRLYYRDGRVETLS